MGKDIVPRFLQYFQQILSWVLCLSLDLFFKCRVFKQWTLRLKGKLFSGGKDALKCDYVLSTHLVNNLVNN